MARQIKLYTNATHDNPPDEPAEPDDAHGADAEPAFIPLSSRQHEILKYIIEGHQNKTIADLLGIELVTVKMHVGMLFKKLGVTNRTMAAVRGVELLGDAGSRHHGRRARGAKVRVGSGDYTLPARVRAALLDRS
ncbi:helix-turn-helix domain-containing protein [Achromobacter ruhlandii]|uniref:helix-turn-helix domain-containing protein n=1 Tax=Achromobacter ruhlandii TaxID=72557 RepID=UPI003B9EFCA1